MLIRPRPHRIESLQSYIIRICRANAWDSRWFSQFILNKCSNKKDSDLQNRNSISRCIAKITKFDEVNKLIDVYKITTKYRKYIAVHRNRICPICYLENRLILNFWYLNLYKVCKLHEVLLIDCCVNCNTRFNADTLINGNCKKCGMSIFKKSFIYRKIDRYSAKINNKFHRISSFATYIKSIDYVVGLHNEIKTLDAILNYFYSRRKKEIFGFSLESTKNKYNRQLGCSYLGGNKDELTAVLITIISDYLSSKNCNLILHQAFDFIKYHLKHFENNNLKLCIRNILLSGITEFSNARVRRTFINFIFGIDKAYSGMFCETLDKYVFLRYSELNTAVAIPKKRKRIRSKLL